MVEENYASTESTFGWKKPHRKYCGFTWKIFVQEKNHCASSDSHPRETTTGARCRTMGSNSLNVFSAPPLPPKFFVALLAWHSHAALSPVLAAFSIWLPRSLCFSCFRCYSWASSRANGGASWRPLDSEELERNAFVGKKKVRAKSNADADNVFFSGYSGLFGVAQRHREWEFGASVRVRNHSNSSPRALTAYSKRRERRRWLSPVWAGPQWDFELSFELAE